MTTSLVGRERPLGALFDAVDRGVAGRGGLVLLAGEAGIGKTSLLAAGAQHADELGALVVAGGGWDGDGVPSLWPWIQVTRAVERSLSAREWERCRDAAGPGIERLLGVVAGAQPTSATDDGGFLVLDAVASLLVAASRMRALVIVLDDLHWADPASVRLLGFLVRQITLEAITVLAGYRDNEIDAADHPLRTLTHDLAAAATTLRISGLDRDAVGELVAREVGEADDATVDDIHRRTGGNPFFAQQTAQLWTATGSLQSLPTSVRDTVDRRLARLPTQCVEPLATAALVGPEFEIAVVSGALGLDVSVAADAFDTAERAGLIVAVDANRRRFVHDLVRETLVASLGADIASRHAAITRSLIDSDGVLPARVAHHAYAALPEISAEAVVAHLRCAADDARARCAPDETRAHLTRALDLTPDDADDWVPIALELGAAQQRAGELDDARHTYLLVTARARTTGNVEWVALSALGVHELGQLFTDDAAADLELLVEAHAAINAATELADTALAARVLAARSRAKSHLLGEDRAESERLSGAAVDLARKAGDDRTLAFCLLARHDAIWKPGTARERQELADEIIAGAQRASDTELHMQGSLLRVVSLLEQGDPRGLDEHRAFVAMAERARLPRFRYYATSRQATIATLQGDFAIARNHVARARELAAQIGDVDAMSVWADQSWEIALLQHRTDEITAILDAVRVPGDPRTTLMEVRAAVARGDHEAVRARRHDFEAVSARWPRWAALMSLAFRAELGITTRYTALCTEVRSAIEPLVDQWAVLAGAVVVHGPLRYWAAALDASLDHHDAAIAGFEAALVAEARFEARPWTALTKVALAQSLMVRSALGDIEYAESLVDDAEREAHALDMAGVLEAALQLRHDLDASTRTEKPPTNAAVFRREGDAWMLVFDGRTALVAEAKGLRDLHTLLGHPGADIPAAVLLDPSRNAEAATAARRLGADPVLDDIARDEYRGRLTRLDRQIEEARERLADTTAIQLEAERDALLDELRRATGLGGRPRRLGDEHERARKTVTARIHDTLRRLDERHPELAAHLRARVSTGSSCRYEADPTVEWTLT